MTTDTYGSEVVATGRIQASLVRGLQITLSMFGPKEALHVHIGEKDDEGFVLVVLINVSPYYIKHIREVYRAHMREKNPLSSGYREVLTIMK